MSDADVIVVEDDPALLNAMASFLAQEGYRTRAFSDPRRAIEAIVQYNPRVVVADHDLPGSDGSRFVDDVRARMGANVPRFVLVASARVKRSELIGLDAFVRKPFRLDELLAHVRRLARDRARISHQRLKKSDEREPTVRTQLPKR